MERKFKTVEAVDDYLMTVSDSDVSDFSDEELEICQLPPDETYRISEEDNIDNNNFNSVVPADVCIIKGPQKMITGALLKTQLTLLPHCHVKKKGIKRNFQLMDNAFL